MFATSWTSSRYFFAHVSTFDSFFFFFNEFFRGCSTSTTAQRGFKCVVLQIKTAGAQARRAYATE